MISRIVISRRVIQLQQRTYYQQQLLHFQQNLLSCCSRYSYSNSRSFGSGTTLCHYIHQYCYNDNNHDDKIRGIRSNSRQQQQQQQRILLLQRLPRRSYQTTSFLLEEEEKKELSPKEKKKLLKAKAKAAAAAAAAAKEEEEEGAGGENESIVKEEKEAPSAPAETKETADKIEDTTTTEPSKEEEKEKLDTSTSTVVVEETTTTSENNDNDNLVKEYSYPELTKDAAEHKAGLKDPTRPEWQNPLHHIYPTSDKIFREDFATEEEFQSAIVPGPPMSDDQGNIIPPKHIQELANDMLHLSMLEMNELLNKIADHYGFHDGMLSPTDDDGGGGEADDDDDESAASAAAAAAEKSSFDIKLVSFDAKSKIKIIKEIRTIVQGLGLKEAKEMVESAPIAIQKGISKDVADEIKTKLEELGAIVEIV